MHLVVNLSSYIFGIKLIKLSTYFAIFCVYYYFRWFAYHSCCHRRRNLNGILIWFALQCIHFGMRHSFSSVHLFASYLNSPLAHSTTQTFTVNTHYFGEIMARKAPTQQFTFLFISFLSLFVASLSTSDTRCNELMLKMSTMYTILFSVKIVAFSTLNDSSLVRS